MVPHDQGGAPVEESRESRGRFQAKARVLIVEDQVLIALALAADLADIGCQVIGRAASGERAVQLARRLVPDIVLMDIHLASAMDGIEAATRIQQDGDAHIVFISAYGDGPDRARMSALQPAAILGKPYDPEELATIVRTVTLRREWAPRQQFAGADAGD